MIQAVLDHLPSRPRENYAPFKIMTRLHVFSLLSVSFDRDANQITDFPMSEEQLKEYMRGFKKYLDEIHKKAEASVKSSTATKRRNAKNEALRCQL